MRITQIKFGAERFTRSNDFKHLRASGFAIPTSRAAVFLQTFAQRSPDHFGALVFLARRSMRLSILITTRAALLRCRTSGSRAAAAPEVAVYTQTLSD
ncbi:hypothetical protein [Bradyrhizobium sp. WSM2793]|uniref:hypothetical protein n=1 Tax=Bradyrhizobium sp. WSM2793 TaxID=1038866 RepID=UPI0012FAB7DD|nr:hypothetical protein [Bradyrhizobium sp. WSM2793]